MKTKIIVLLLVGTVLLAATPSFSYAGHYGGGRLAGPLIGGLLAGAIIGSLLSQPHYVAAPQPVFVYPQPVRVYCSPCPFLRPGLRESSAPGRVGRWSGQVAHGQRIPAHRAWVR